MPLMARAASGLLLAFLAFAPGCATTGGRAAFVPEASARDRDGDADPDERDGVREPQYGIASYYARRHDGRRTASGEIHDEDEKTAAHRTLPFGTRVKVTHLKNHKDVTVRINDRGPFVKGRVIDLSRRAAKELDLLREGTARVKIEVLDDD